MHSVPPLPVLVADVQTLDVAKVELEVFVEVVAEVVVEFVVKAVVEFVVGLVVELVVAFVAEIVLLFVLEVKEEVSETVDRGACVDGGFVLVVLGRLLVFRDTASEEPVVNEGPDGDCVEFRAKGILVEPRETVARVSLAVGITLSMAKLEVELAEDVELVEVVDIEKIVELIGDTKAVDIVELLDVVESTELSNKTVFVEVEELAVNFDGDGAVVLRN